MRKAWDWVRTHRALVGATAIILLADRATKAWALYTLSRQPVIVGKYLWLDYVENTGAAFGMFQHGNTVLIAVMLLVIGYLIWNWKELTAHGACAEWGCLFILAGALGNLYDRLTLGFVVDFLDFRVWPVFNVADSFITIGAILLGICLLKKTTPVKERK